MTRQFFDAQMARMTGLRFVPADLDTHWEGLSDLPDDVLEAAVSRAVKVRIEFPVPSELREDADVIAPPLRREPDEDRGYPCELSTIEVPQAGLTLPITREWRYYCDACSDTGWDSVWCGERTVPMKDAPPREIAKPWQASVRCERRKEHGAHEWVQKCACWESNPALVKKRERQQKYAESAGKPR